MTQTSWFRLSKSIVTVALIGALFFVVSAVFFRPPAVFAAGGSLIVKLREHDMPVKAGRPAAADLHRAKTIGSDERYKLIETGSPEQREALKAELAADPNVEYVEENQVARALFVPNDPLFDKQWNLRQINAPLAWDRQRNPGAGVIVAVLDTGITKVPDLAGTTFVPGYDFVNSDPYPDDDNGHGTHVAGIIAQTTNNNYGAAGLAFKAALMPVKVLDGTDGSGYVSDIAEGIKWAADHGAKVINLSLGASDRSRALEDAVDYAGARGAVVVAATGNFADWPQYSNGGMFYPAAYRPVISVGATNKKKRRAGYSQFGAGLDLTAPGGSANNGIIQQTIVGGGYGFYRMYGTSAAAPHVSGAAAMLIAKGVADPDIVAETLTQTAQDLGSKGYDREYGHGLLDVAAALAYKTSATTWYFADGATHNAFDTKILIGNPKKRYAKLRVTFSKPSGVKVVKRYKVAPGSRRTISIDAIPALSSTNISAKVESLNGVEVVAERAMYFKYRRRKGGHVTRGSSSLATTWYFAEGKTAHRFETQIIVYNPNNSEGRFRAVFTKRSGSVVVHDYTVPAWGSRKIIVDKIAGMGSSAFSTKIESLNGVAFAAERSMYFYNYRGRSGGHNTVGAPSPARRWFFAEGVTGRDFDTEVVLYNPRTAAASIKVDFFKPAGRLTRRYRLGPGRRKIIKVDKLPGLSNAEVSVRVRSANKIPIIAERAVYFDLGLRHGGHIAIGQKKPAKRWYLAGGFTGGRSDSWILVFNPKKRDAKISLRWLKPDGSSVKRLITVPALSRRSVYVDAVTGMSNTEFSTVARSRNNVRVIVERSTYFTYKGYGGGGATMGFRR